MFLLFKNIPSYNWTNYTIDDKKDYDAYSYMNISENTIGCSVKKWTFVTNDVPHYVWNDDYGTYRFYNHYYGVKSF